MNRNTQNYRISYQAEDEIPLFDIQLQMQFSCEAVVKHWKVKKK